MKPPASRHLRRAMPHCHRHNDAATPDDEDVCLLKATSPFLENTPFFPPLYIHAADGVQKNIHQSEITSWRNLGGYFGF